MTLISMSILVCNFICEICVFTACHRLSIQALKQLHPDVIAQVDAKALFSRQEEKLLATIHAVSLLCARGQFVMYTRSVYFVHAVSLLCTRGQFVMYTSLVYNRPSCHRQYWYPPCQQGILFSVFDMALLCVCCRIIFKTISRQFKRLRNFWAIIQAFSTRREPPKTFSIIGWWWSNTICFLTNQVTAYYICVHELIIIIIIINMIIIIMKHEHICIMTDPEGPLGYVLQSLKWNHGWDKLCNQLESNSVPMLL